MAQPWKIRRLDPETDVPACLKKILRTRAREMFSYSASAMDRDDTEALHDMRVTVRRLMTLLKVYRAYFEPQALKKQLVELKSLRAELGAVRDHDVFIETLLLHTTSLGEPSRSVVDDIIEQEKQARNRDRKRLRKKMKKFTRKHFMRRFTSFLDASMMDRNGEHDGGAPAVTFRGSATAIVPELLNVFFVQRSAVIAHPRALVKLHAMRIDGKRVRYGMEIFADIFGTHFRSCLEDVKTLVDRMGTIHDCDVHVSILMRHTRTHAVTGLIKAIRDRRAAKFNEVTALLQQWEREGFTGAVAHSMTVQLT